jgi:hypothetical protein
MSRPTPLRRSPVAALVLGLVLALSAGVARPLAAQGDDAATLAAYHLTEAKLAQFTRATRAVVEAVRDPAVQAEAKALGEQDDDDAESIADVAAKLERMPAFKRAVASSGMTMRDYVTFQFALFQAAFAQAMLDQYPDKAKLPAGVSQANVDFVRAHKAQLEQITAELKKLEEMGEETDPPLRR